MNKRLRDTSPTSDAAIAATRPYIKDNVSAMSTIAMLFLIKKLTS
ncbi:MAG: hypothetical protein WA461_11950 [Nitrososphaeraceae archaeon]